MLHEVLIGSQKYKRWLRKIYFKFLIAKREVIVTLHGKIEKKNTGKDHNLT